MITAEKLAHMIVLETGSATPSPELLRASAEIIGTYRTMVDQVGREVASLLLAVTLKGSLGEETLEAFMARVDAVEVPSE